MPIVIYVLGLIIFCMNTSEFMVAGMMNSLATEFGVSVSSIGYLISGFAAGMVVGGPLLTAGLLRTPKKQALLLVTVLFLMGQTLGALAWNYEVMMVARIITGVASSAAFGVSISLSATLTKEELRGRASSIIFGGMMIANVIGVPASTVIEQVFGWRISFWLVAVLVLLSGVIAWRVLPASSRPEAMPLRGELSAFRNRNLWAAYTTSFLIIGATFAGFSYFTPIFTEITGVSQAMVPLLLVIYGAATVVGNLITGRLADQFNMQIMFGGLVLLVAALTLFALGAQHEVYTIIAIVIIGLVGVPMNPAMVTRVMRAAGSGLMVSTVHTAVVTLGVTMASSIGGLTISAGYGLVSPLWVGAVLALLGLLTLLPYVREIFRNSATNGAQKEKSY
ncbi:MFS transporter [Paenibacillus sp. FSL R10-2736]|uniref:MFS transporter n=1 Tax=Paenibacillus sp. FSL R10-2736 TaxID=2954692 RepID=UPI0030F9A0C4